MAGREHNRDRTARAPRTLGRSASGWRSRLAVAALCALGLVAGSCSVDDAGPATGPLVRIAFRYESPARLTSDELKRVLVERIEGRLALLGVDTDDESLLVQAGDDTVAITCRGCEDLVPEIREVVPRQGQLRFRPVLESAPGIHAGATSIAGLTEPDGDRPDSTVLLVQVGGANVFQLGPTPTDGRTVLVAGTAVTEGRWQVTIRLSDEAQVGLDELAAACHARTATCPTGRLATTIDGEVLSAPRVTQPTFSPDEVVLDADQLDETSARRLAGVLQWGPLPVRLHPAIVSTDLTTTAPG